MTLDEYRIAKGWSKSKFAEWLGVSQPSAWRYLRGERSVPLDVAIRIEDATDGEITVAQFFPELSSRLKKVRR